MALNDREIAIIKGMLLRGDRQHDIASYFGVNGGRIAEIAKGAKGSDIEPASAGELPAAGPYIAGRSSQKARDTLTALRDLIDETLTEIEAYERDRSLGQ